MDPKTHDIPEEETISKLAHRRAEVGKGDLDAHHGAKARPAGLEDYQNRLTVLLAHLPADKR